MLACWNAMRDVQLRLFLVLSVAAAMRDCLQTSRKIGHWLAQNQFGCLNEHSYCVEHTWRSRDTALVLRRTGFGGS